MCFSEKNTWIFSLFFPPFCCAGTGAAVVQAAGAGHAAQDPLCSRPDMVSGFASPLEAGCCSAAACSWVAVESGRTHPPVASPPLQ